MPRIPYIPDPQPSEYASPDSLLSRVRARRIAAGHDGLVELDRMLLHSPSIAEGWNAFLGAVRTRTGLDDITREIVICRVAVLNGAEYEWGHHAPILRRAIVKANADQGDSEAEAELDAEKCVAMVRLEDRAGGVEASWLEMYLPLMDYVDAMTKAVKVDDSIFTALRRTLPSGEEGNRSMVEITSTCAAYNCVSRFLVALDVGDKNPQ